MPSSESYTLLSLCSARPPSRRRAGKGSRGKTGGKAAGRESVAGPDGIPADDVLPAKTLPAARHCRLVPALADVPVSHLEIFSALPSEIPARGKVLFCVLPLLLVERHLRLEIPAEAVVIPTVAVKTPATVEIPAMAIEVPAIAVKTSATVEIPAVAVVIPAAADIPAVAGQVSNLDVAVPAKTLGAPVEIPTVQPAVPGQETFLGGTKLPPPVHPVQLRESGAPSHLLLLLPPARGRQFPARARVPADDVPPQASRAVRVPAALLEIPTPGPLTPARNLAAVPAGGSLLATLPAIPATLELAVPAGNAVAPVQVDPSLLPPPKVLPARFIAQALIKTSAFRVSARSSGFRPRLVAAGKSAAAAASSALLSAVENFRLDRAEFEPEAEFEPRIYRAELGTCGIFLAF